MEGRSKGSRDCQKSEAECRCRRFVRTRPKREGMMTRMVDAGSQGCLERTKVVGMQGAMQMQCNVILCNPILSIEKRLLLVDSDNKQASRKGTESLLSTTSSLLSSE